jgi:hypothetical protein
MSVSSDSDSAEYHQRFALLTELVANPNPWEYMDEATVPSAYDAALYNLRLSSTIPSHRACRRILETHRAHIEPLAGPLFTDVHTLYFDARILPHGPASGELVASWNTCYAAIYAAARSRRHVDSFLDLIPFFLTYTVLSIYTALPTPLGICPPSRAEVSSRIAFLFTSFHYLESHLDSEMARYFGPDEVLLPFRNAHAPTTVLLPLENIDDLVDLERRPRDASVQFKCESRSPLSQKRKPRRPGAGVGLLYPRDGERTFREGLKPFSAKPKAIDDFSPDLDTRSLLMRARSNRVTYGLRRAKMKGAVERIGLMHRFQQDREMIELKRRAVTEAGPESQQKFIEQLARNQAKGLIVEDPAVTLDLLRDGFVESVVVPPLSTGKRGKIEAIVDIVLNDCAMEHRRKNEVEVHCSREMRNAILDVTRVFEDRPLPP